MAQIESELGAMESPSDTARDGLARHGCTSKNLHGPDKHNTWYFMGSQLIQSKANQQSDVHMQNSGNEA